MAKFKEPRQDANKRKRPLSDIIAEFEVNQATNQIMESNKVNEPPGKLASKVRQHSIDAATAQIMAANDSTKPVDFGNSKLGRRLNVTTNTALYGDGPLGQRIAEHVVNRVPEYTTKPKRRRALSNRLAKNLSNIPDGELAVKIAAFNKTGMRTLSTSSNNAFFALGRFISSFGDRVRSLLADSRNKIEAVDPIIAVTMKDKALEALTASTQQAMRTAFDKYSQGRIDRKQFAQEMEMQIRRQALGAAIIGVEGTGNLTANVIEATRGTVAQQLAYLDGFIRDIEGRPTTNRDRARAMQYGNAAFSIAQTAMRQFDLDGAKSANVELEEKRILGASDEHCADCIELATEKWEPFGTLPVPGTGTICGSNCKCELVRRYKDDSTPNPTNENSEGQL